MKVPLRVCETRLVSVAEIRELAKRFSADQLEHCLNNELEVSANECMQGGSPEEIVATLAEAEFVREQVERGVPLGDAIRELARRIRAVQRGGPDAI
jgi:hypothetical protein